MRVVVEDDRATRALPRDVLERAGHRVIERGDGRGPSILVERERFDMVILDEEMPEWSGLDLLSFVRNRLRPCP